MKVEPSQITVLRSLALGGLNLRVVRTKDGSAWFMACDVCKVLALEAPQRLLERLHVSERLRVELRMHENSREYACCTLVNVAGLLALVGVRTATAPELAAARGWLAQTVLPAVLTPEAKPAPRFPGVRRLGGKRYSGKGVRA